MCTREDIGGNVRRSRFARRYGASYTAAKCNGRARKMCRVGIIFRGKRRTTGSLARAGRRVSPRPLFTVPAVSESETRAADLFCTFHREKRRDSQINCWPLDLASNFRTEISYFTALGQMEETTMQGGFEALELLPAVPHSIPSLLLHSSFPHNYTLKESEREFSKCEERMDSTMRVKSVVVMEFVKQADLSKPPKRFWRTSWRVFASRLVNTDRGSTAMIICND